LLAGSESRAARIGAGLKMVAMLARCLVLCAVCVCLLGSKLGVVGVVGEAVAAVKEKDVKEEDQDFVLYTDIKPANRTDSVYRLSSVPIYRYEHS
jgi:hypothetical protein